MAVTYTQAAEAPEPYVVVLGLMTFDPAAMPPTDDMTRDHEGRMVPARIEGKGLTAHGFDTAFEADLTIDAQCLGPWCARAESGETILAFIEQREEGYLLSLTPCGGMGFAAPSDEDVKRVEACHRGEGCDPA